MKKSTTFDSSIMVMCDSAIYIRGKLNLNKFEPI